MDHSRQCFCAVCHSLILQLLQGIDVNVRPSATVKSRALIRLNNEGGDGPVVLLTGIIMYKPKLNSHCGVF